MSIVGAAYTKKSLGVFAKKSAVGQKMKRSMIVAVFSIEVF